MLNYLRKECRQSRCVSLQDACYCGGEYDDQHQFQEDCLPITTNEIVSGIQQFIFDVDLLLLQQPLGAMAELLTPRHYQIFSMRYSAGFTPSEIARALAISPARVTQAIKEAVQKLRRTFLHI